MEKSFDIIIPMLRIGYPCMNLAVKCSTAGTFRIGNYSEERFCEKLQQNLNCLKTIFAFNKEFGIEVYRVSSNLVPYGSHPIQTVRWQEKFAEQFKELGELAAASNMRLSTHPGQFVLLNAPREEVVTASIRELEYQADVLDLLSTGSEAKIQIHVGGVYGDKEAALERFGASYATLSKNIRDRLVIENDERLFTLEDCYSLHEKIGVPIIFDSFHHQLNPGTLTMLEAFTLARSTWGRENGPQQMDFSEQDPDKQVGAHSESISPDSLRKFLDDIKWPERIDIMLEVKDKERSVLNVRQALSSK